MKAALFPGQGSQYVGMGRELYDRYEAVRRLYDEATEILGFDLKQVSFSGPDAELVQTSRTQPAIFVHSLAVWTAWGENRPAFDFAAGHSLGEFSALTAAGATSFTDGLRLVKVRSHAMQKACDAVAGTMAALLNLPEDKLEALIDAARSHGVIQAANFNSVGQVAVSGERAAVEHTVEIASQYGARRATLLPVGGAFHSPLMESARAELAEALARTEITKPQMPVVLNVTAKPSQDSTEIRTMLDRQLTSPVLWMQSLRTLRAEGVTEFVELGPGKVLQGLVKRTLSDVTFWGIDTAEDLDSVVTSEAGATK